MPTESEKGRIAWITIFFTHKFGMRKLYPGWGNSAPVITLCWAITVKRKSAISLGSLWASPWLSPCWCPCPPAWAQCAPECGCTHDLRSGSAGQAEREKDSQTNMSTRHTEAPTSVLPFALSKSTHGMSIASANRGWHHCRDTSMWGTVLRPWMGFLIFLDCF